MRALPDDVEARLTRAVGAYLRVTPAHELPAALRRFQNFRPRALAAQRRIVLDALDDDAFRALVGEWLDDRPTLAKADAELLRIAVERPEGWADELAARGATKTATPARAAPDARSLVDKEKAKTTKARAEARRIRETSERRIESLETRIARLEEQLAAEKQRARAAEVVARSARAEADKAAAALAREQRKARAAVEKARGAAGDAREELKRVRSELQAATKEIARLTDKPAPQRRKPTRKTPPGPRKPLPVPPGRLADAPETLAAWLAAPDVRLLVDGYNASMSASGFAHLDLEGQRQRLVDELAKLTRRTKVAATVVFDGSDVSSAKPRRPSGNVKVHYSAPGEIADDYLIALLDSLPTYPVVVVTSDRELQERATALGATIATSEQLLKLLR